MSKEMSKRFSELLIRGEILIAPETYGYMKRGEIYPGAAGGSAGEA